MGPGREVTRLVTAVPLRCAVESGSGEPVGAELSAQRTETASSAGTVAGPPEAEKPYWLVQFGNSFETTGATPLTRHFVDGAGLFALAAWSTPPSPTLTRRFIRGSAECY